VTAGRNMEKLNSAARIDPPGIISFMLKVNELMMKNSEDFLWFE